MESLYQKWLALVLLAVVAAGVGCAGAPPRQELPPAPAAATIAAGPALDAGAWQGLPVSVPGRVSMAEEGSALLLQSTASVPAVEEYCLDRLIEGGWLPVERLRRARVAPAEQEGVFLRLWRAGETACVLATGGAGTATAITLTRQCSGLSNMAEGTGRDGWAPEERGTWSEWQAGRLALRHPVDWAESPGAAGPCDCQAADAARTPWLTYRQGDSAGSFYVSVAPAPAGTTLDDLVERTWQSVATRVAGLTPVAAEPLYLGDGTAAAQLLWVRRAEGQWSSVLAVNAMVGKDCLVASGTVSSSDPRRLLELSEAVAAMARSVRVAR